jgi:hypothetical protein
VIARLKREQDSRAWLAWHAGVMSWPGNKTTLQQLMGRPEANAVRVMSPEEIEHTMRRWAVVTGMAEAAATAAARPRADRERAAIRPSGPAKDPVSGSGAQRRPSGK